MGRISREKSTGFSAAETAEWARASTNAEAIKV
jgi:hypothetical protein